MSQCLYRPLQSATFILLGVLLVMTLVATHIGAIALEQSAWLFWLEPFGSEPFSV